MTDRKAVIKNADMSEDMQQDAVDCATQALEKYNIEKDIAAYIKKEFDKKYNPTWHCIVGRNFGSYVTHETKHFIYFYLGQVAILLFKSGWTINNVARLAYTCCVVTSGYLKLSLIGVDRHEIIQLIFFLICMCWLSIFGQLTDMHFFVSFAIYLHSRQPFIDSVVAGKTYYVHFL